ncbi:MAG: hypothetical protein ACMG6S_30795 [Byssovorax sp.]
MIGVIQQNYATLRDLDELGVAAEALAMLTPAHKRRGILAASGRIAGYLREKHTLPFKPDVTPLDSSGLVGGGSAALTITGNPALVHDVVVRVAAGGVVGVDAVTIEISTDAGATFRAAAPLALHGALEVDGVTLTFTGTLDALDLVEWSTCVDRGLCEASVAIAAYLLLNNRGLSAETMESVEKRWEKAEAWAKVIAGGDARLDKNVDATPNVEESGPRFTGQRTPWQWLGRRRSLDR